MVQTEVPAQHFPWRRHLIKHEEFCSETQIRSSELIVLEAHGTEAGAFSIRWLIDQWETVSHLSLKYPDVHQQTWETAENELTDRHGQQETHSHQTVMKNKNIKDKQFEFSVKMQRECLMLKDRLLRNAERLLRNENWDFL